GCSTTSTTACSPPTRRRPMPISSTPFPPPSAVTAGPISFCSPTTSSSQATAANGCCSGRSPSSTFSPCATVPTRLEGVQQCLLDQSTSQRGSERGSTAPHPARRGGRKVRNQMGEHQNARPHPACRGG